MTPRETFQKDRKACATHASLVDDVFLEMTLETALFEMLWQQGDVPMPDACRQNDRLAGAKEFLTIWRELSDKKTKSEPKDEGALERE